MRNALIVHGGCGLMPPEGPGPRQEACERAADAGWRVLQDGGSALDAVETAVRALEDEPVMNAGTGSYLQADGVARLDASLMAADGRAGAVAQVPGVRNPIRLARYILEQRAHVMLAGPEALQLALRIGLEAGVLATPERVRYWHDHLAGPSLQLDYEGMAREWRERERLGTVGCVALDGEGRLAAGTSTGGTPHCYPGRVGDTPVIGAGTYCTRLAGVSMTGLGEAILVKLSAKRLCDLAGEGGLPIDRAARRVLAEIEELAPASAALIALDVNGGTVSMHDTEFMAVAQRSAS
jgi:beta-aspartyl-peptidase (threonine type)